MHASVGDGGKNQSADVRYVQFLLSDHLASGDEGARLQVDGICGPKTREAIKRFQQGQLGFADGRVDPGGPTIRRLQQLHFAALARSIRNLSYLAMAGPAGRRPPLYIDDAKLFQCYLRELHASL